MTTRTDSYAIRIKTEGGKEAVFDISRIGEAMDAAGAKGSISLQRAAVAGAQMGESLEAAAQKGGNAADRMAQKYARAADLVRSEIDPLHKAQVQLNADLERYNELLAKGFLSTAEANKARAGAVERFEQVRRPLVPDADMTNRPSQRQMMAGRLNLARQGADVFTTAAMGMSPAMIAIQQGPQILDAMATSGMRLTPVMGLAATAALGFAAAVAVIGGNILRTNEDLRSFTALLAVNADGHLYNAKAVAEASRALDVQGASVDEARKATAAFLQEGVNPDRLREFGEAALYLSKVTGVDMTTAANTVAKAFTGTYKEVAALDGQINFLSDSELKHIKTLFDSKRAGEARNEAFRIFNEKYGPAYAEKMGEGERFTQNLSGAWDNLVQTLSNTSSIRTATDLIGDMVDQLSNWLLQYVKIQDMTRQQRRAEIANVGERYAARSKVLTQYQDDLASFDARNPGKTDSLIRQQLARKVEAAQAEVTPLRERWKELMIAGSNPIVRDANGKPIVNDTTINPPAGDKPKTDRHAESLARQAEAAEVNIRLTRELAQAYDLGDAAVLRAEARRTALTQATRKGTDASDAERRVLAQIVADREVSAAQMAAETRARIDQQTRLQQLMRDGNVARADAQFQMQLETELRPLIAAQTVAEGDAKVRLTRDIEALTQARKTDYELGKQIALQERAADLRDQSRMGQAQIAVAGLPEARQRESLRLMQAYATLQKEGHIAAMQSAVDGVDGDGLDAMMKRLKASAMVSSVMLETLRSSRSEQQADQAQFLADQTVRFDESTRMHQVAMAHAGDTAQARERALAQAEAQITLERLGIELSDQRAQTYLRQVDAQVLQTQELQRQTAYFGDMADLQERSFDTLVDGWRDWKNAGLDAIGDIAAEFMKLAVLNPLKNLLFGGDRPTLKDAGGVGSFLGDLLPGLFGGGDKSTAQQASKGMASGLGSGLSSGLSAGLNLKSFEGGGDTGTGPRSGGLDGRGGYLALLHPDETVIDHRQVPKGYSSLKEFMELTTPRDLSGLKARVDRSVTQALRPVAPVIHNHTHQTVIQIPENVVMLGEVFEEMKVMADRAARTMRDSAVKVATEGVARNITGMRRAAETAGY